MCDHYHYEGQAAQCFIDSNLVRDSVDSAKWQVTYKNPQTGDLWLEDWLHPEMQGGGIQRLRLLPLRRPDLIEILVLTGHLDVAQRQQLGSGGVRRSELAEVISRNIGLSGWYPVNARPWPCNGTVYEGFILQQLDGAQVKLWVQRHAAISPSQLAEQRNRTYSALREAVQDFISGEWPLGNIDGICVTPD